MSFYKYQNLMMLNDLTEEWNIRVRAQSIWKGINRETGEFRGYNILFVDDSSERIHAFITPQIGAKYEEDLKEGLVYTVKNFRVKYYSGDETNRAIRNDRHIYFTNDTALKKDESPGLDIPEYSFDLFMLDDLQAMKSDNRFLTDVVAVIQQEPVKTSYIKDSQEKSHVYFSITDGNKVINVTFFNEFGDSFLKAMDSKVEQPFIITLCCVKVSDWKGSLHLRNFPSTRFYLNANHYSVALLRKRLNDPKFYAMDIVEEMEEPIPLMKVNEIRNLPADYIEKNVLCQLKVKKVDERMNWYIPVCTQCDIEVPEVDKKFQCINEDCRRVYPYPDRRFQLYTLCGDETGNIPIVWPNDEICRITGKTVYDLEVDEDDNTDNGTFPQILKFCEKKIYNFTLFVSINNVKEGSNVYKASKISEVEFSATHSPPLKQSSKSGATKMSMETDATQTTIDKTESSLKLELQMSPNGSAIMNTSLKSGETEIRAENDTVAKKCKNTTPQTGKSSNKIRTRMNLGVQNSPEGKNKQPRLNNVKLEKD